MASKPKPKPKPKEFSKEDLTCVICLDRLKEPTLLPCFHTYCKACLEALLRKSKNRRITCPQCRSTHPLPTGGVGRFPADRVLENALDLYTFKESQAKHTALPCSMCTEDDPSIAHCSTCGKFLCDFCAKAHRRQVSFRDHKVVTLDQLSSDAVKSLERPRYCSHHPEEILKLYCNTCQALICRDCSIIAHRDHSFNFAKDVRSEVQLQLEQATKGVTVKQQEFEAHLAFIKEAEKTRHAYSVTLSQQVIQVFELFIRSLESLRKQLLEKEAVAKASDMKQIWAQKQSIEMTLANIASGLRYAERLFGCPNDVDMLAMSSEVKQQLLSLQKTQWNPKVNLSCSPLLVLSSQGQEYVTNTATLKALDSDSFTISIQLEGFPVVSTTQRSRSTHGPEYMTQVQKLFHSLSAQTTDISIGQKVQFLVEVKAKEGKTQFVTPLMIPSISIKESSGGSRYYRDNSAKYTMKYKSNASWLVEFKPLHSGNFTVTASLEHTGSGKHRDETYILHVRVKGTLNFNIGDRVRRGPDWTYKDVDGGVGNSGTVISKQEYKRLQGEQYQRVEQYPQPCYQERIYVYVKWDSGKSGQYECNRGPFALELDAEL